MRSLSLFKESFSEKQLIHHITSHSARKGEEVRITGVCEKGEGKTADFDDSHSVMASTTCEKVH